MKHVVTRTIAWINAHSFPLLITWITILTILYGTLSIVRHNTYQSGAFDLGVYDQEVWQYSRFLYPYNTVKDRFILGDHLNLTTPLIAPLFWIWDDVRMLFIFQAVWIGASVAAVYLIAKNRKLPPIAALCISAAYSLFFGIQYLIYFDFHAVAIGVGLLAWLVLFLETGKKKLFIITLLLLLLTQENMGLALVSLGMYYLFKKSYRKTAVIFIIVGFPVSLLAAKLIASVSPVGFQYTPHISLNPITNIVSLFNAPEKRQIWLWSFLSFGFLPLFSPGAILAFVVDVAQYFVTGPEFTRMWTPYQHHRGILAIYLILGTIDAFIYLKTRKINIIYTSVGLLIFAFVIQYALHLPLNKLTKGEFWHRNSWMTNNDMLITAIPKSASVATQQDLVPHLTHREKIYLFWPRMHDFQSKPCGSVSCWWLDFPDNPQYLLVDLHPNQWLTQLLETNEHVEAAVTTMTSAGVLHQIQEIGNVRLYRITQQTIR